MLRLLLFVSKFEPQCSVLWPLDPQPVICNRKCRRFFFFFSHLPLVPLDFTVAIPGFAGVLLGATGSFSFNDSRFSSGMV